MEHTNMKQTFKGQNKKTDMYEKMDNTHTKHNTKHIKNTSNKKHLTPNTKRLILHT